MKLSKKLLNLLTKEIYQQKDEFKDKIVPKCYFVEYLYMKNEIGKNETERYIVKLSIEKDMVFKEEQEV